MTLSEARIITSGKLIFGNEEQIKAVKFLALVLEVASKIDDCDERGDTDHSLFEEMRDCDCNWEYDDDVVEAAIEYLREP